MKPSHLLRMSLLVPALIMVLLFACKRDKESTPQPDSASSRIAASEQLSIPAAIAVPSGSSRTATYYATGVQQYKATVKPNTNPAEYQWTLVGPRADLYDQYNSKVGTHGAGPHWTLTPHDSIFAQQFSPARTAPSPHANSIDWLLLMPKSGTTPTGFFAGVDYIQRIATEGGKAPAEAPTSLTQTVDIPYKAIYRFSKD